MRRIHKGHAPPGLSAYAPPPSRLWSELDVETKRAIQRRLHQDQSGLCAYCMSRIASSAVRIEHFVPQAVDPALRFEWTNLLGVCAGDTRRFGAPGARSPSSDGPLFCEAARGSAPQPINPAQFPPDAGSLFEYSGEGEIRPSKRAEGQNAQLAIESLRLNCEHLKAWRKQLRDEVRQRLRARAASVSEVDALIAYYGGRTRDGLARPYCEVALQFLARRKRKLVAMGEGTR